MGEVFKQENIPHNHSARKKEASKRAFWQSIFLARIFLAFRSKNSTHLGIRAVFLYGIFSNISNLTGIKKSPNWILNHWHLRYTPSKSWLLLVRFLWPGFIVFGGGGEGTMTRAELDQFGRSKKFWPVFWSGQPATGGSTHTGGVIMSVRVHHQAIGVPFAHHLRGFPVQAAFGCSAVGGGAFIHAKGNQTMKPFPRGPRCKNTSAEKHNCPPAHGVGLTLVDPDVGSCSLSCAPSVSFSFSPIKAHCAAWTFGLSNADFAPGLH